MTKQSVLFGGLLAMAGAACSLNVDDGKPEPDTNGGDERAEDDSGDEPAEETSGASADDVADEGSSGFVEESGESGGSLDPVWDCYCGADCDGVGVEWADFVCAPEVDAIDEAVALAVDTCAAELDPECEEFLCECECELIPDEICGD